MSRLSLAFGILLLFATEILRIYFIMPFPGSQHSATIDLAYSIEKHKWLFRIAGYLLVAVPLYRMVNGSKKSRKIIAGVVILLYAFIFFKFNFRFQADKMFRRPETQVFYGLAANKVDSNRLVIGIEINGQARAYPIQVIGYHHQVRDTLGNALVMVTYCTVCRTGRVYSPLVNGKPENFRLVGMDHFNAMFEDASTLSWWRQATGEAIAGPLKGNHLQEIASQQATLATWFRLHPNSTVLQPDPQFKEDYADLEKFDKGNVESHLEKRDSASWKNKSWVVGVRQGESAKAYDWNDMLKTNLIQDTIGSLPILIVLEADTSSFHVYSRLWQDKALFFFTHNHQLTDSGTHSVWSPDGVCVSGVLKDARLSPVAAYQEFWHSWKEFHPNTTTYNYTLWPISN